MKKRVLSVLMVLMLAASLLGASALAANSQHFDEVTVNADGTVDGFDGPITLIVDGLESQAKPGKYHGNVFVVGTESFEVIQSAGGASGGPPPGPGPGGASDAAAAGDGIGLAFRALTGDELINSGDRAVFRTALYVDENGFDADRSVTDTVSTGFFTGWNANNVTVRGGSDGFAALVVENTSYEMSGADILMDTASDGTGTNDFTGLGSAVSAYGAEAKLTIRNSHIETTGVAKPALYINGGADVIVYGSTLRANGGTVYDTYMSNANSGTMLSPPWHLGIDSARGNSRTVNLMGAQSTETLVDSEVYASGWGALSVDNGSYMRMDIVNSKAEAGEGYGAFAIGQVTEHYYGSTVKSGNLGFILMGGNVYMGDYTGGETVEVRRMEALGSGKDQYYGAETDELIASVKSQNLPEGKTVYSELLSDRFGVEMHSMMNGDVVNGIHLSEGTTLKTGETAFIVKAGFAEMSLDDCDVRLGASPYTGERVLVQVMDNDDAFCSAGGTNAFDEYFWEPAGWSYQFGETDAEDYALGFGVQAMDYGTAGGASYEQWTANMDITDTEITGDLWNSSGYWKQGGTEMRVSIGAGASVEGVISSGAYAHPQKTYEVGLYGYYKATGVALEDNAWYNSPNRESWENAKYISVVENTPYFYGANGTAVSVTDGGVWKLTGTSFVTALNVKGGELENVGGIWKVTVDVADRQNMTDAVSVAACEEVAWDGGDIELTADDSYTFFVLVPEGADIDSVITVGAALGANTPEFEGEYLGSFYVPGEGVLETPLDIY